MKLSLQMPQVGPAFEGGRVLSWAKEPGESFEFGDELCVIAIEQIVALRKTQQASVLTSRRRKKKMRDELEHIETSGPHFQLVASEPGVMLEHIVPAGGPMRIGDLLAVIGSGGDDDSAVDDPASLPQIRVVSNHLEED